MVKIFWFRKDLRIIDNNALSSFLSDIKPQDNFLFLYIKNKTSFNYYGKKRINFLCVCLQDLKNQLKKHHANLYIYNGNSIDCFMFLLKKFKQIKIFANIQVEPYCSRRDKRILSILSKNKSEMILFNDTTIFSPGEICKDDKKPYTVFTPFKKKCLKLINKTHYEEFVCNFNVLKFAEQIDLDNSYDLENEKENQEKSPILVGGRSHGLKILEKFLNSGIDEYKYKRDYPSFNGTSMLSAHLHFGTVNIRECYRAVLEKLKFTDNTENIETWNNELLWREFYYQITYQFPHISGKSFKSEYDNIEWTLNKEYFSKWCNGLTGYPIVDAGMKQLRTEGWMHNRVRMIVAMFLTKDLFIDWRSGEKYFAEQLIDLDFASNNGGWQWSASTGCDAQPYFRIFNPYLQSKKYDENGDYIRKYIDVLRNIPKKYIHKPDAMPFELQKKYGVIVGKDYPFPIVDHKLARDFAINSYKKIKTSKY